jgi:hypothetical protein
VSFRFGYDASGNDVLDTSVDLQVHDIDNEEPAVEEEEEVEGVDEPSLTIHELAAMKTFICYERNLLELISRTSIGQVLFIKLWCISGSSYHNQGSICWGGWGG